MFYNQMYQIQLASSVCAKMFGVLEAAKMSREVRLHERKYITCG